jgi:nitrite reductase (NADH) large subunit
MQRVVDSYQCEWKTTIADPERLRLFRSFVNDEAPDPSIVHVPLRDQHRVATWDEKAAFVGGGI